jgi:hypothetical protein
MNAKMFLWLTAIFFLTTVSLATGQQTGKVPRIAFLLASSPGADSRVEGFRQGLLELGYIDRRKEHRH